MLYERYMKKYKDFKKELLKDKDINKNYKNLNSEFYLIELIIKKRIEKGFTQKDLAQKIGTKQSAVSRLESGDYNPSVSFLQKIAQALDSELKISLTKK